MTANAGDSMLRYWILSPSHGLRCTTLWECDIHAPLSNATDNDPTEPSMKNLETGLLSVPSLVSRPNHKQQNLTIS